MTPPRTSFRIGLMLALFAALGHQWHGLLNPPPGEPNRLYPDALHTLDAEDHLRIESRRDVREVRAAVRNYLWPDPERPLHRRTPQSLMAGPPDLFFPDDISGIQPRQLAEVELLEYAMPGASRYLAFHLRPSDRATTATPVIVHQGHQGGLRDGIAEMTNALLSDGHPVVLMQMPMVGWNRHSGPVLPTHCGDWPRSVAGHDQLFDVRDRLPVPPMTYFIEPVIAVVDFLVARYNLPEVAMLGLSGGGWTTHVAAAIEPRIRQSFPVAGSYPLYLRPHFRGSGGDAEQIDPALYVKRASWLDLYLLAGLDTGREQLQILNLNDPCCFHGRGGEHYAATVVERLAEVGKGQWELMIDDSHRGHAISPAARAEILRRLSAATPQ